MGVVWVSIAAGLLGTWLAAAALPWPAAWRGPARWVAAALGVAIVAAVAGFVLALNLPHRDCGAICGGSWRALLAGWGTALVEPIVAFVAGLRCSPGVGVRQPAPPGLGRLVVDER
jgi:hypothetical protein